MEGDELVIDRVDGKPELICVRKEPIRITTPAIDHSSNNPLKESYFVRAKPLGADDVESPYLWLDNENEIAYHVTKCDGPPEFCISYKWLEPYKRSPGGKEIPANHLSILAAAASVGTPIMIDFLRYHINPEIDVCYYDGIPILSLVGCEDAKNGWILREHLNSPIFRFLGDEDEALMSLLDHHSDLSVNTVWKMALSSHFSSEADRWAIFSGILKEEPSFLCDFSNIEPVKWHNCRTLLLDSLSNGDMNKVVGIAAELVKYLGLEVNSAMHCTATIIPHMMKTHRIATGTKLGISLSDGNIRLCLGSDNGSFNHATRLLLMPMLGKGKDLNFLDVEFKNELWFGKQFSYRDVILNDLCLQDHEHWPDMHQVNAEDLRKIEDMGLLIWVLVGDVFELADIGGLVYSSFDDGG
jgi:hypothetical protein